MSLFSFFTGPKKVDFGAEIAAQHGITRSPHWPQVEHTFRDLNSRCTCCGFQHPKSKGIQVHHKYPFHDCILAGRPDLEVDFRNLISLCENEKGVVTNDCHLLVGHLRDFKSYNPTVATDATTTYHGWLKAMILADGDYQKKCDVKPKSYPDMTTEEKLEFRKMLDQEYPQTAGTKS